MAVIFLAMRRAPPNWIWAPYLDAFAEAGMVGACADWFAVVALLRCPLGLPIHHTEVVPENKRRIGPAMGRFITNNFLSRASPSRGVRRSTLAVSLAARWLEDERNAQAVAAAAGYTIPYALDLAPKEAIDEWVALATQRGVEAVPAAPFASHGLSVLWAQEAGQTLLDQGLNFVETTLARHKATIVKHVSQKPSMARAGQCFGEKLIDDLAHGPEMRAQGEALKQDFLANPVLAEQTRAPWEELETALRDDLPRHCEAIIQRVVAFAARPAGGWKMRPLAGRGSTGGSGCWRCARCCPAGRKSVPISPRWSTIGTPPSLSIALSCKSARICDVSASTARWSGS
jgi:uncharacterized membrane-anchored protein YjiN (DUF445 family)